MKTTSSPFRWSVIFVSAALIGLAPADSSAAAISLTSNYSGASAGTLNLDKLMNGAQGGHPVLSNYHFIPDLYPKFVEAGIRTVRVSHLLNDLLYFPVSRLPNNTLQINFSRVDTIIDPLIAAGMKPMMNISFTPDALGGTTGDGYDKPNNWTEWEQCVTALVQHYYNKGLAYRGLEWMVWNEPDHGFFVGSPTELAELYERSVRIVKQIDPTAKVGGYGEAHVEVDDPFLPALLTRVQNSQGTNPIPLDFVAIHQYFHINETGFDTRVNYTQNLLNNAGLGSTKIYITEWGWDGTQSNRDAPMVALKMYQAHLKTNVAKIFYFQPVNGFNVSLDLDGYFGLINSRGHRMSMFYAFKMMKQMQPTILPTTYGGSPPADKKKYGFVTKNTGNNKVSVLLWNWDFAATTMDVTISNLPYSGSNVKVTKYIIDGDNSNYYADPSYLKLWGYKTSPLEQMDVKESAIVAGSGTFSRLNVPVPPYSVVQFLLEPTASAVNPGPVDPDAVIPLPNLAARRTVTSHTTLDDMGWFRYNLTDELKDTHSFTGGTALGNPPMNGFASASSASDTTPQWVQVDFELPRLINQVKLYPRNDYGMEGKGFPRDFEILGWTGSAWQNLATHINYNNGNPPLGAQTFNFASASYSKVRVHATRLGAEAPGVYRLMLAELEAYGSTTPEVGADIDYKLVNKVNKHLPHLSNEVYVSGAYKVPVVPANFNSNNQKWRLVASTPGYWKLRSVANTSLYLQLTTDIYNGLSGHYHVIASPLGWGGNHQDWELVPVTGTIYHKLRNRGNTSVVLQSTEDIYNANANVFFMIGSPEATARREQQWVFARQ